MKIFTRFIAMAIFILAAACMSRADGILIPGPWPPAEPIVNLPPSFSVKYHHVDVKIEGQIARTHIDQVFVSDYDRDIEATYLFPIPEGAVINEFNMWSGKDKYKGTILDAAEARRIYEQIVRHMKDPGLLEYASRGVFRASVYPVPAHGEKRIEIEYTETLSKGNNIVRYSYPLNTERFSAKPLQNVTINVDIHSSIPIKNVYSPSHNVSVRQSGDRDAGVSYEENNTRPNVDFTVYYTLSEDDIGLGLITFKPRDEDGFFLFLASPRAEVQEKQVESKDVVFVFDRTGSMSGEKIEQAREALKFCLRTLNPGDRFDMIPFNESPDALTPSLVSASKDNINKAVQMADATDAMGGTNIDAALAKAISLLNDSNHPAFIVFLTDGQPTVGTTDIDEILADVNKVANKNVRMFVFGVGYDVNTSLLDRLTQQRHGAQEYVRPGENIEVKVSNLFRMISYPILADLQLDYGDMETYDIYPGDLPDIFKGTQIVVAGRYRGNGRVKLKLTGRAAGAEQKFTLSQSLEDYSPLNDFVPLIWAQRKIAFLISEIRQKGQNKELVDEIVRLSKKYGIITEYTSFLVTEPDKMIFSDASSTRAVDTFNYANADKLDYKTGGSAVNQSMNMNGMATAVNAAPAAEQSYYNAVGDRVVINNVQNVGTRTFFQDNSRVANNWVENTYRPEQKVVNIKAYSEAHFQLLEKDPSLGSVMSLGNNVLFNVNGNAVQISDTGTERFTDKELKELFGS